MGEPIDQAGLREQWPQGFRITLADGRRLDGVEFPSGRVVLDDQTDGLVCAFATLGHLLDAPDMQGATIERPKEAHHGL